MNNYKNELQIPVVAIGGKDPSTYQLPDPDLLIYYQNLQDREIWIDGELDEITNSYIKQILQFNKDDRDIPVEQRKPIKVFIDSPGGYLASALSLANVIKNSKTKVITINICEACSGAFLVFIAGHERLTLPSSWALYHRGSGQIQGSFDDLQESSVQYKESIAMMQDFVINNTSIPKTKLTKRKSLDWWMNANQQIENGVADRIINSIDDLIG